MSANLIEMRNISKSFGAVTALSDVTLTLPHGSVLGLVGDNAAGKSTLMKVLAGAITPDRGKILIDGAPGRYSHPIGARDAGIEMIYQDFALVPDLTVAQNIFLGREIMRSVAGVPILDRKTMSARARELFAGLGLRVPSVTLPVVALSGGQQQAVAIARATAFNARLVIMDEPTANLGAPAIEKVRETITRLKENGVAVIIISHRLEDIFAIGDAMMVMKQGRVVGTRAVDDTENAEIVEMIVTGRDPRERTAVPA
ncbi:sugar ABC transporter ATP-binding protein [Maribius pontilimi]|uniref:Sugar ABC transporter ATP-binding protein n=1 Tax=Palleronia pontilimi TaxID=1964209 RepID=A0A934IB24_9RHOB|nr:ATP-binding cassette domain-containing protein [Palleronia pontilimi]MBJ3763809.1 sugar ABC transporter ATP-binding protein [Palleronia pontilimi]